MTKATFKPVNDKIILLTWQVVTSVYMCMKKYSRDVCFYISLHG